MHEFSIAYDIYKTAKTAALAHHADSITKIVVDVGELAMVNPEQVEFLFSTISEEDPLFSGICLEFHNISPTSRCRCGYEGNERYVCPQCGALPELIHGREVTVRNIEIEVNDS